MIVVATLAVFFTSIGLIFLVSERTYDAVRRSLGGKTSSESTGRGSDYAFGRYWSAHNAIILGLVLAGLAWMMS